MFHGAQTTVGENADGVFFQQTQEIPQDFLDDLRSERLAKQHVRYGELNKVASVPELVWDLWVKQGRDPWNASPREIVAWLNKDGLDAFVTARV